MNGPPAATLWTANAAATQELAAAVASVLQAGDVVALSGELGAGKTCFVQGAARALGVDVPVTSPTFVLMKQYRGDVEIVHADVYRLDRITDVLELGDDVFAPDVVTFVEWADAILGALPEDRLDVEVLHGQDPGLPVGTSTHAPADDAADLDSERRVTIQGHGTVAARWDALLAAVAPWRREG